MTKWKFKLGDIIQLKEKEVFMEKGKFMVINYEFGDHRPLLYTSDELDKYILYDYSQCSTDTISKCRLEEIGEKVKTPSGDYPSRLV